MLSRLTTKGFTIVELLIVIVVIAILASVTVVAYEGIQNRAHDTAVQNDLSILKKKFELFYVEKSRYIVYISEYEAMNFSATTKSYAVTPVSDHNIISCHEPPEYKNFDIIALSKSGTAYVVSSRFGSVKKHTGTWHSSQATICSDLRSTAPGNANYRGYALDDTVDGPWRPWTQ